MASGFDSDSSGGDFEQLARQYWNAWGQTMRDAVAPAPGWSEAIAWWVQQAMGAGTAGASADAAVDRLDPQANGWFAQMQQLAAQFAGKEATAADVASSWKQMLGGAHPFADLIRGMPGPGQSGNVQGLAQAAPILQAMRREGHSWLGLPALGFTREHQERWQELGRAQLDYQEKSNAYHTLMAEATQLALRYFEQRLAEHAEPGRQIESVRALFDLWIDAAEQAYAEIALSPRFREVYGALVNAQMRVRAGVQREVEQYCSLLGMPTRTEVDAAHRRIVQLERELRRLHDMLEEREAPVPRAATPKVAARSAAKTATRAKRGAKKATPPRAKPSTAKPSTAKGGRR